MSCEKSFPAAKMDLAFEGRFFPPGSPGDNHASGIDKRGNAGIGDPDKIPPVFDGPHRAEIEVV